MTQPEEVPTPEQAAVLASSARLRIVRAVPGSGKTWLVARLIKQALAGGESRSAGLAALSFTRVAGDEVRLAVGRDLSHPHFVGTLDAFVYRYVVRPFLRKLRPSYAVPRLLPAEWSPGEWEGALGNLTHVSVPGRTGAVPLLSITFVGEGESEPVMRYRNRYGVMEEFSGGAAQTILAAKRELWRRLGWMSHSDVAFIGARTLGNVTLGAPVRREIARRFPLVVLDEAQDTGWFLGQCVRALLAEPAVRGVVVGDPDQAIYEFNGARPELFDAFQDLEGAVAFPLSTTYRCSRAVSHVATALAQGHEAVRPREAAELGSALLLSYEDMVADVQRLQVHLAAQAAPGRVVRIVARGNATVDVLRGGNASRLGRLGSKPLNHMHRAVVCFRRGRQGAAIAEARAAIGQWLLDRPDVDDETILQRGVEPVEFRVAVARCLLEASREVTGETVRQWGERVRQNMVSTVDHLRERLLAGGTLPACRPVTCRERDDLRAAHLPTAQRLDVAAPLDVQTVHAVKGETHDLTVLVCPRPSQWAPCPSVVWWSEVAESQEERRIAFVAASRPRGPFILCVAEQTMAALRESRPDFVARFECATVADYLAAVEAAPAATPGEVPGTASAPLGSG